MSFYIVPLLILLGFMFLMILLAIKLPAMIREQVKYMKEMSDSLKGEVVTAEVGMYSVKLTYSDGKCICLSNSEGVSIQEIKPEKETNSRTAPSKMCRPTLISHEQIKKDVDKALED